MRVEPVVEGQDLYVAPGGRTIKLAPITLRLRSLHHAMPEPKATTADDVDDLDGMPYTL